MVENDVKMKNQHFSDVHKSNIHYVENHLVKIGVKKGYNILDFGCGEGSYTSPLAKILDGGGMIFAIDEDQIKLDKLSTNAKKEGVGKIIRVIKTDGQFEFSLENEIIDITLLYNVTCCIIKKDDFTNFQKLIKELYRITKNDGKIVIGIKEEKTILERIENGVPLVKNFFILERKERDKYFDGEKLRNGLFYHLKKKII